MPFNPNSKVQLFEGVPLDSSQENQRWFDSISEQNSYFANFSPRIVNITDSNYVEKQWIIFLPYNADTLNNVNYMRYMNNAKWFYCFVNRVEYVNPNTCALFIELDNFQTYLFDLDFNPCLVEREHVSNDSIGSNVVPEPFDTNFEKISIGEYEGSTYKDFYFIIDTTLDLSDTSFNTYHAGGTYGGVVHGSVWYAFSSPSTLSQIIDDVGKAGKLDAIINIFMLPTTFVTVRSDNNQVIDSGDVDMGWIDVTYPANLDGYTPKNKKLLTYPYCEIAVTNKGNDIKIFRPERFSDLSNVRFRIYRVPTIGNPAICFPYNYNGIENDFKNSVSLEPFPQVSWINNPWGEWQNANIGSSLAGVVSGAMTGGVMGSFAGGVGFGTGALIGALGSALSSWGQAIGAQEKPRTVEGNAGGNSILSTARENTFRVEVRTIDKDNAKSFDDFLSRFGYKVNELKMPNFHSRQSWNYVKTSEMSVTGKCPIPAIDDIKNMFNRGITLWHVNDVGNYSLSNSII